MKGNRSKAKAFEEQLGRLESIEIETGVFQP